MPSSTRYLTPHPPVLFSPPAKNLASGSTNSFSSSSSSSNSRSANYFERLSRASAASAYLTDLTPPITPSNSNLEVESKGGYFNRTLDENSGEKTKLCPLFRSTILSDEDAGYRSDTDAIGTTTSSTTGIPTLKRRGTGRRALRLMEDHTYPESEASDSDDVDVDVPLLSEESSDDRVGAGDAEADREVEREYFDEENFSRDFERGMQLMYQEVMNGTSLVNYAVAEPEDQPFTTVDLLGDEPDFEIPSKPVVKATELDWDGSPLSLNDDPSFESISGSLISPIQPDSLPIMMSPAIYNEPPVHGSYPFSSPHMAISTLMFGTRGERRSFPLVDLNGENLDIASLIRLEVATGNNVVRPTIQDQMGFLPPQSHPPPSPFSSYPSLQSLANATNHSPRHNPFTIPSPLFVRDSSPTQGRKQTPVEPGGSVRVRAVSHSPMPVDRDQALVGLGLGALTEGCLRSSDSISKLDSLEPRSIVISDANRCTADIALDTQQCSPCVDDIEECLKTEIEPSGVLSGSESLQSRTSHTSIVNQDVQLDLPSYQVNLGENPGQVSIERDISCHVENIEVDATVESESESNVLSDSVPRTDVFSGSVSSGRRCSTESHKTLSSPDIDHEEGIQCAKPLIVQAPTFTGQNALSYPSDTVPITPDSTHLQSTSTLAENAQAAIASSPKAHLAVWTDDVPRQSIEHPSLLFQDSPLRRLTLALESDGFLARLNQSLTPSPASSTPSHGQKTRRTSRLGTSSPMVSPKDDPRSPCPESMEYFHPESYIRGCLGVLPTAQSPSGGDKPLPLPSSSRPDSFPLSLFSGLLWESKSFDGLGLGLPSNLVPGPPRQRESSVQQDDNAVSTTEECQNIAQLADTLSSPSDGSASSTSPRVLFQVPTFAQRRLYVIPEQPSPLSTFSGSRSRSPSPGRRPSKSLWSAASILTRLRSSSRLTWRSVSRMRRDISKTDEGDQINNSGHGSSSSVSDRSCPLVDAVDDGPPTSKKSKRIFRRLLEKISARRSGSTPSSGPLLQLETATVRSPGVIEHPNAPRTFGILTRGPRGRLGSDTTKFQVLF